MAPTGHDLEPLHMTQHLQHGSARGTLQEAAPKTRFSMGAATTASAVVHTLRDLRPLTSAAQKNGDPFTSFVAWALNC